MEDAQSYLSHSSLRNTQKCVKTKVGLDAKAKDRMMGASKNLEAGPEKIQDEMKELLRWWDQRTEKQRSSFQKKMKLNQEQSWEDRKAARDGSSRTLLRKPRRARRRAATTREQPSRKPNLSISLSARIFGTPGQRNDTQEQTPQTKRPLYRIGRQGTAPMLS